MTWGLTDRFRVAEIRILLTCKTEGNLIPRPSPPHTVHSKVEDGEGAWSYDSLYCLITSTNSLSSHHRLQLIYQCYNKLGLTVIQPEGNQLHITMHLVKFTGPLRAMCYPTRKLQCIPPYIKSSLTSWTATHRLGFLSTPLMQQNMATLQQVQYSQETLIIHLGATDATPCSVSNSHHLASPFSPPLDPPRVIVLPL